jgi:hypothetical protein
MDDRPRAASPVLPVGRVIAGMENLSSLGASVKMKFTAI